MPSAGSMNASFIFSSATVASAADRERRRRDDRADVRLEEVGAHAGDVADVVADVVGDHHRVVRVVLVDARLDLADEIGADVGRLRVWGEAGVSGRGWRRGVPGGGGGRRKGTLV